LKAPSLFWSEGGLTDEEKSLLKSKNCDPHIFGPRIMWADTAAIAALTLVQALAGIGKPSQILMNSLQSLTCRN
jgi:hypothetical protein